MKTQESNKMSWRQRRAERKIAKAALREAAEVVANMPAERVLNSADRAISMAARHVPMRNPAEFFSIPPGELDPSSKTTTRIVRTFPVGSPLPGSDGIAHGFIGTFDRKMPRKGGRFLDDPNDRLYLARYDTHMHEANLMPIDKPSLSAMPEDQVEALAVVADDLLRAELEMGHRL